MKYLKPTSVLLIASCLLLNSLATPAQDAANDGAQVYSYRILNSYPHNINSFTQGLIYHEGFLFEGTGKKGLSTLSKINLDDGEVVMSESLSRRYFGEGIEVVEDKIYQLTWTSHMVFVWDKNTFEQLGNHYNATQGWGLAYNGEHLILSDGTSTLQFVDPETFVPQKTVTVTLNGNPLSNINELEYINGEVWANVWQTDFIVRINSDNGVINSYIDLTGLRNETQLGSNEAVLNGIAWDAENERLFVTGKHWANLFEIEIVDP